MNDPLDSKQTANESMFEESKHQPSPVSNEEKASVVQSETDPVIEQVSANTEEVEKVKEADSSDVIAAEENYVEKTEAVATEDTLIPEDTESPQKQEGEEESIQAAVAYEFATDKLTIAQILERLDIIVEQPVTEALKAEVDALKQAFYKQKRVENEEAKKSFIAAGGEEQNFIPAEDEAEEKLKTLIQAFKDKRASVVAENEKIKEENLAAKKAIIEELKTLIESQDDFYKVYNEFRKLQLEWKDIKAVPQANVNDLWKEYQHYSEKFYDLLKINNEMRDYDFKKNMELKTALCEAVEKLEAESDIISAFYQLQKFHQDWREIGPVAKELREEIWSRFKKASTVINKKHQEHFEELRDLEQHNLDEKTAICEEMEAVDYSKLNNFKDWDEQNKRVLELQDKWKTIGFAPKKYNVKIFERFRAACDLFFQKKSEFYRDVKDAMDVNLEKKKVLCEKAEALKDSQDWKETTDKLIALQKEWKTIGSVSRKHSDAIWKRFINACDYFFEQKNTHFSSQKTEEQENLKLKKAIIEQVNAIDINLSGNETISQVRALIAEWNNVGFVPFKDKDKIYKEYKEAVDKHFDRLKVDESERRLQTFKSNITEITGNDRSKNKLFGEREKLMRTYERLKNDIQTYENNIGFLSVSSKGGGGLVKEMSRKIESLKEELELIVKKIGVIDESLEQEK